MRANEKGYGKEKLEMYSLTITHSQLPNIHSNEVFPRLASIQGSLELQGITIGTGEHIVVALARKWPVGVRRRRP